MRCSEPGKGVAVAIIASHAPGRWAWVVLASHWPSSGDRWIQPFTSKQRSSATSRCSPVAFYGSLPTS